jgi:hypothetical protein
MLLSAPRLVTLGLSTLAYGTSLLDVHDNANFHKLHQPLRRSSDLSEAQDGPITLVATATEPGIIVLDFGVETEGIPSFDVVEMTGHEAVLEVTYSETSAALNLYMVCDTLIVTCKACKALEKLNLVE